MAESEIKNAVAPISKLGRHAARVSTSFWARYARPEAYFAMLSRCVHAVTLFAAGISVIWRLGLEEQGYFFAFTSLGSFFQLSDFGISYSVLQTASHFAAVGQQRRLPGLLTRTFWLNFAVSVVATAMTGAAGAGIFSNTPHTGSGTTVSWQAPWAGFICSLFLFQLTMPLVAFVEGGISAAMAWRFRLFQEMISAPVFVAALICGCGLWSLTAFWCARFISAACWLHSLQRPYGLPKSLPYQDWVLEIWPFQWKIGISALCGFLLFYAFSPIIIAEKGPTIAGKFGFSLALMNMLLLFTPVWPQSQISRYATLVSQRRFNEVRRSFLGMLTRSTALAATIAMMISVGMWLLTRLGLPFMSRFSDPLTTSILLATGVLHHITHCFAVILRAGRREPLLTLSIVGGLAHALGIWIAAHFGGPHEIACTSFFVAFTGIPVAYVLYLRSLADWVNGQGT